MGFKQAALNARHHIVFLLGLFTALVIAFSVEERDYGRVLGNITFEATETIPLRENRVLTQEEVEWANKAWQYFENNYQSNTGLVNSVNGYPSTTMWDTASYLMGLISAEKLNVISHSTFELRMEKALHTLARLPLVEGKLPNKAYNTQTLEMVDYDNTPVKAGIGWSAIDIGRILVPLNIMVWQYPQFNKQVNDVLNHWDVSAMIIDGYLYGSRPSKRNDDGMELVQEGRIGYEEYASKAMSLMGRDVFNAMKYIDYLEMREIDGIDIPTDLRDPAKFHAHNYVVSESYILDSLEFGADSVSKIFAHRVYKAQENRYERTGILTAVSEDNTDEAPYFVYNTVFSDGKEWNAITDKGEDASHLKSLSTKAAFGWYALYDSDYTALLIDDAKSLYSEKDGWYSGRYEVDGRVNKAITANTNGIVLESLAYIENGSLLSVGVQ
ncbi:DUF3131 domain-containing protein [Photobacterium aphoticum]|uniref:DUF3131 domain-containing protein n=1 Tax=Photobacterium aphoticum TaxID=754436 RepID=A0A090QUR9_9GAMM|nr:DUF3131 domain-containing protein [Photobacterium aphoticum]KLV03129.1 hypothetical protein ABT58_01010 [Photobacterium aphoticum]PSU56539.1 DUF3131 domain-containing protein [Photobacterium aphoticum]GAL06651.1 hypothetical protein JCM19237_2748 [Photobacterium aphoticum]GHA51915.1 hypothetical protein GCM10007086_27310 [Photobacterium aphoticum]